MTGGGDPPGPLPPAGDVTSATGGLISVIAPVTNTIENTLPPPPGGTGQGLPPLADPPTLLDQLTSPVIDPIKQIVDTVVPPVMQIVAPVIGPVTQIVDTVVPPVMQIVAPVIDPVTQIVAPILAPVVSLVTQVADPILTPVAPVVRPVVDTVVPPLVSDSPATPPSGPASHTPLAAPSGSSSTPAAQPLTQPLGSDLPADAAGAQTPFGTLQPGANPSTPPVAHGAGLRIADAPRTHTGSAATVNLAPGTSATAFASFSTAAPFGAALIASHDRSVAASTAAGRLPAPAAPGGLAASGASSGSGGFSPTFFLALLVAFAALARLRSERVRLPSITWRPIVFIAIQERPG